MLYPLSYEGGDDAELAVKLPSGRCSGRWRRYSAACGVGSGIPVATLPRC